MPELPEVEVTRRRIAEPLRGATVGGVRLGKPLRWPLGCAPQSLVGLELGAASRRGKYLWLPLLRPQDKSDECLVAVKQGSPIQAVEDLAPGCRVASTEDPDVNLVGMMFLEPADLDRHNTQPVSVDSYPLVAKALFNDDADVGFFLEDAYSELSNLVRKELRELVRSQISDITHVLLSGPRLTEHRERLIQTLSAMPGEPKTAAMLEELGFSRWQVVDREDTEFMIDLMDALMA